MEIERNNVLDDFRYGFCNLSGEYLDAMELDSELGLNEDAINLLMEIYPIVGKMNLHLAEYRKGTVIIDEYDFLHDQLFNEPMDDQGHVIYRQYFKDYIRDDEFGEVPPMKVLSGLSDYNDIVVGLRKLLYSEIELSNYKILDKDYDETISNILFELGLQFTNFYQESFLEGIRHSKESFALIRSFPVRSMIDSHRVKELVSFLENQIRMIVSGRSQYNRLELAIRCVEAIKNSGLVANADKLWNIFLLKLYSITLFNDELNRLQETEILFDNDRYESIVRSSYKKIDNRLQILQRRNIQNMLHLYSLERMSSRAFYNNDIIRGLFNALNSSNDLRGRYLNTINNNGGTSQNPSDKKTSSKCFAAMYNRDIGKKYAAISGVFDADRYIYPGVTTAKQKNKSLRRKKEYNALVALLKSILGNSYEVIDSDDDVEYFYKKSGKMRSVTAKRFINYPYPVDKEPGNRMFSCCERKLSTKFVPGCEHDIYVKYAPCTMCDRMITEKTKNNIHFINVFCAGKISDLSRSDMAKYDKAAEAVK